MTERAGALRRRASPRRDDRAGHVNARAPFVLASASPRRRWLLEKLGVQFEILAAEVDERRHEGESPAGFAERMADEKAAAVERQRSGAWILAADTVVAIDDRVLGKPRDPAEAVTMLSRLAGRRHTVFTAMTLLSPDGTPARRAVIASDVTFRPLAAHEIDAYVATGEPFDRAGAYAIQGEGAHLVDRVDGSYTTVIGLPLPELAEWLRACRIP